MSILNNQAFQLIRSVTGTVISCFFLTIPCIAQWDGNPATVDNTILNLFSSPKVVSDKAGGAIVVMESNGYLYAQRKSAAGQLLWNTLASPVQLFNASSVEVSDVKEDGQGGAYLAYTGSVNPDTVNVYLQHLDSNGNKLLGTNGVQVNPVTSTKNYRGQLSVGNTGITVVWGNSQSSRWLLDSFVVNDTKVFIQRFNVNGDPLWPVSMPVSLAPFGKIDHVVESDGNDGTYVIFSDFRNFSQETNQWGYADNNLDLYMQYFDAGGNRLWGGGDSVLNAGTGEQFINIDFYTGDVTVPDGAGGFELVYVNNDRLCAQRVNKAGEKLWRSNLNIGGAEGTKYGVQVIPNGGSGLVATWLTVPPSNAFIFAQQVSAAGNLSWTGLPLLINAPLDVQLQPPVAPGITRDQDGDFVFSWYNWGLDSSNADNPPLQVTQIKGQKVTPGGLKAWHPAGSIFYQAPGTFVSAAPLVAGTGNKTIAVWGILTEQDRSGRVTSAMINPGGSLSDTQLRVSENIRNGDWNDPTIWADGNVPAPGASVIIRSNVTVNQNLTCKTLKVVAPGVVTVAAGFTITITE